MKKYLQRHFTSVNHFTTLKALTHSASVDKKIFLKRLLWKLLPIYKTVDHIVAVLKKVVVCMEDNCIFCSFVCSMRGPLSCQCGVYADHLRLSARIIFASLKVYMLIIFLFLFSVGMMKLLALIRP